MAQATNEDCLFVSVFAPAKPAGKLRPVMVWIHGGGFLIGSEFTFTNDGKMLASLGDVVVVTINYRLGVLGLLYGGDDLVPPNLGLYDQVRLVFRKLLFVLFFILTFLTFFRSLPSNGSRQTLPLLAAIPNRSVEKMLKTKNFI